MATHPQCWCAVDPDLTKNGEELALDECDMACEGTASGEFCGGIDKKTAYKIEDVGAGYVGCYADDGAARAMGMEEMYVSEDMTNEVRETMWYDHNEDVVRPETRIWCSNAKWATELIG